MNAFKYIICFTFLLAGAVACKKDVYEDDSFVKGITSPEKLSALFDITQDNSGLVTITPNGEGASTFDIYYGHGAATSERVMPGNNTQHVYPEGLYDVRIVATNISGKTTELIQKLTVSFRAPENLKVTAAVDPANNFKLNVSATATYETLFKVYYGDGGVNEVPVSFLEGETKSHIYATVGTFIVRVVALSGGVAFKDTTLSIKIFDPVVLPLTFESATVNYAFNNFGGGETILVANPQSNGINTSAKVAKMVKSAGEVWGGSVLPLTGGIDFSSNKIFRMKVFSPRVGAKVLLKVENAGNGAINFEKEVATTVANQWEDMVFDYGTINTSNAYSNIVLIFDNGTVGDGTANFTFLVDDIRLTNTASPMTQIDLPVTFDDGAVNYSVTDFGGAVTGEAADPSNVANKVMKTTKPAGAEQWAGTTVSTSAGFATAIPMSSSATKMSLRVYSPAAGIKVRLKIEDHTDPTKSVETDAFTTVANTWETLVFDFSNQSTGTAAFNLGYRYDMASVFFDFLANGTGKVFYWDDLQMESGAVNPNALALPLEFESTSLAYSFNDFDGGVATVVSNPASGGINTSGKVVKMVKNAGQPWGGSWIGLTNPIDFSSQKTITMKVYSPRVGAKIYLKFENQSNGEIFFGKEVTTTSANAWELLTFDCSAINTANTYQKIVLILDNGTAGNGTADYTIYMDDITLN
jgi:hypothetical protein